MYPSFLCERKGRAFFLAVSEHMVDKGYVRKDTKVKKLKFTHIIKKKILCLCNPDTFTVPQRFHGRSCPYSRSQNPQS